MPYQHGLRGDARSQDGQPLVERARSGQFDLLLRCDDAGTDVCPILRAESDLPIIRLMPATPSPSLTVDDDVTKPFSTSELVSRVRALLRRRELDRTSADGGEDEERRRAADRLRAPCRAGRRQEREPCLRVQTAQPARRVHRAVDNHGSSLADAARRRSARLRRPHLDLPAQVRDVHVAGVLVPTYVALPEVLHDLPPGEDALRLLDQAGEQLELGRRQLHRLAVDRHLVAREVDCSPPTRRTAGPLVARSSSRRRRMARTRLVSSAVENGFVT